MEPSRKQDSKISLVNGRIHTQSGTEANVTFEHGRIASFNDDTGSMGGKVIDLHGRTVLPGFIDTGTDFLTWAESQERLNLSNVHSVREMTEALTNYSRANPNPLREWYIASNLPDEIIISHDDLDAAVPELPCAVIDAKKSHAVLNTQAMNEFNMPQDNVELDEFTQHLPKLSREDIVYLVRNYSQKVNALGITEVWSDFSEDAEKLWDIFFRDAYDFLTFRMRCNFAFNTPEELNTFLASGLRTGDGLPFCKLGGIIIKDGLEQQAQKNMITACHLSGCQVITDNNKSCLNALEKMIKKSQKSSRHLVRNVTGGLLDRMSLLGLGGITFKGDENNFLHEAFQNGLVISAGSGENLSSPLKAISSFVSNGLSVAEALSVYTWSASWNAYEQSRRGGLTVGNDADIVILEQDPFLVRPEEIANIDVAMTFCAGCAVYDSGAI
ncbi:MAG: amidohydrolase family protein [Synergistaceae bacterium]|nr:amidohydrolase family protein [Synergistaceae bacterium]